MDRIQRVSDVVKWMIFDGLAKNQTDLALKLGYTKSSFSQIINGKVNISDNFIDKLKSFAPQLNKEWLLNGTGEMFNTISIEDQLSDNSQDFSSLYDNEATYITKTGDTEIMTNSHGNKFTFYPDGSIYIEVLKVPFSAHASYITTYQDDVKIKEDFNTVEFRVDKFGLGYYLAFDVEGDSMNGGNIEDTPSGAEVLAREVGRHLWEGGFRQTKYGFIVVTKDAIFHKDITNYNQTKGVITLSSRNKMCKPFEYKINDVHQVFHVIKRLF